MNNNKLPYGYPREDSVFAKPFENKPFSIPHWTSIFAGLVGVVSVVHSNYSNGYPLVSRLPRMAVAGLATFAVTELLLDYKRKQAVDRDIHILHYAKLHAEELDLPPRVKYGDIILPFEPAR